MTTTDTVTRITRACMFCDQASRVQLTTEQAAALDARTPVQDVMPDSSPELRELLISGTHPACWDTAFN